MTAIRLFCSLPAAGLLLLASCAAPYLHHDAMLSATTAEMNGSQIDSNAVMLTVTVPFRSLLNPSDQTLLADKKKPVAAKTFTSE